MPPEFHALIKRERQQDDLVAAEQDGRATLPRLMPRLPTTWLPRLQHPRLDHDRLSTPDGRGD